MPTMTIRFLVFLVVAALSIDVYSIPVPPFNLTELVRSADLVVIGKITAVSELKRTTMEVRGYQQSVRMMMGEIQVDSTFKGDVQTSKVTFHFLLPEFGMGYHAVSADTYRMLFLKNSALGYEFASPFHPSLVAIPGIPVIGESDLDKVVNHVSAVLLSGRTSPEQKQEAIRVLRNFPSEGVRGALRHAAEDEDYTTKLSAVAVLLYQNDISRLEIAKSALLKISPNTPGYLLHNLAYAIGEGVRNEHAIPALTDLLRSSNSEVRRAATQALKNTKSTAAIAPLVRALNDPEFEIRHDAVVGLSEITGQNEWAPTYEEFMENETRYLSHWRSWARDNGVNFPR